MTNVKKIIAKAGSVAVTLSPMVALAQFGEINTFVGKITTFLNNIVIPLIFALALVVFIWGMFRFFIAKTDSEKDKGKDLAIWAIVAFVLMVSVWGIVNLIANGLGFSGEQVENIPTVPTR